MTIIYDLVSGKFDFENTSKLSRCDCIKYGGLTGIPKNLNDNTLCIFHQVSRDFNLPSQQSDPILTLSNIQLDPPLFADDKGGEE